MAKRRQLGARPNGTGNIGVGLAVDGSARIGDRSLVDGRHLILQAVLLQDDPACAKGVCFQHHCACLDKAAVQRGDHLRRSQVQNFVAALAAIPGRKRNGHFLQVGAAGAIDYQ